MYDKRLFIDVKTATEMGIAVYTIGGPCTEEVADTTMCHILNLYRRVSHLNEAVKSGITFTLRFKVLVSFRKHIRMRYFR